MDKLWAPWRINYVQGKKKSGCVFCLAKRPGVKKDFVIFKTRKSIALLNIFPYNNGHLMVAPLRHVRDISLLDNAEVLDLFASLNRAKALLEKVLAPDGYNIGINVSRIAGAGIPGHLHIHIVPRWNGDTNFMPVLNNTKIISQSLEELHKRLKACISSKG
ncbi:MAG: HIT domain-containing protein [Candidatus Omnitrophica bacterium]|jgi:ATP adenylyltransferase|nr:HIT domain-containing protein [Candidatus Omnitrophota bacterium]MDD5078974.1 HIT domain-containing protein [Candidatus Omnitrophota bacterium]